MSKTGKSSATGRPTDFDPAYCEQAAKLCALGATDNELADFFNVNRSTIYRWKIEHKEFCDAIKTAKQEADERVERSLYERAVGYSHPDTHITNFQGVVTQTDIVKHYPPDPTAMIFWLKNRRRETWRDKHDVEHSGTVSLESMVGASFTPPQGDAE